MQRCVFCQAEFEETADRCPDCGQQSPTLELEMPQLSERVSGTAPLPAVAPLENGASEAATLPAAPGREPENLDEHDLPTSAESGPPAAGDGGEPKSGLLSPRPDDELSQDNQPLPQDQIPVVAVSSSETSGARFANLWRKPYARVLAIILAVIVVASGSGAAFYYLTLPRPALRVSGPGQVGSYPAGSADQVFHVIGQKFSANSAITFLLDGKAAPGAPSVTSDTNGDFTANLPITDDWLVGSHMLTAKDAKGYVTYTEVQVRILPAPVLLITSNYQQNAVPAGSTGTSFHLSGKRFPLKVSITLLVDTRPLSGSSFSSDARGRFEIDWMVARELSVGTHTITATDARGDTTADGVPVTIVQQGDAGTPGPNGAPANDASFSIMLSGAGTFAPVGAPGDQLDVTGQPDPAGGKVCGSGDDVQRKTTQLQNPNGGVFMTITTTYGCSGTYKYGHLTYTETVVHIVFKFSNGTTCTGGGYIFRQLKGTFTNATTISGTVHTPDAPFIPCTDGSLVGFLLKGPHSTTWTGTVETPQE